MKSSDSNPQSGQVGVVILLMMAVVFTVAISLSQRTLQQQDSTITQDESIRVFNAAESGVENALFDISEHEQLGSELGAGGQFEFGESDVSYSITDSSQFEMFVLTGNTVEIPLNTPTEGDSVEIQWKHSETEINCSTHNPPALIVSVINLNNAKHYAYDPCPTARGTNFYEVTNFCGTCDYQFTVDVPVSDNDLLLRIKPIFADTGILVSSSNQSIIALAQYDVASTALNTDDDIVRTIEVKRSLPGSYSFMDYTLVSGSNLTKN